MSDKETAEAAPERPVPVFPPRIVTVTDRPATAIPAMMRTFRNMRASLERS